MHRYNKKATDTLVSVAVLGSLDARLFYDAISALELLG